MSSDSLLTLVWIGMSSDSMFQADCSNALRFRESRGAWFHSGSSTGTTSGTRLQSTTAMADNLSHHNPYNPYGIDKFTIPWYVRSPPNIGTAKMYCAEDAVALATDRYEHYKRDSSVYTHMTTTLVERAGLQLLSTGIPVRRYADCKSLIQILSKIPGRINRQRAALYGGFIIDHAGEDPMLIEIIRDDVEDDDVVIVPDITQESDRQSIAMKYLPLMERITAECEQFYRTYNKMCHVAPVIGSRIETMFVANMNELMEDQKPC